MVLGGVAGSAAIKTREQEEILSSMCMDDYIDNLPNPH